MRDQGPIIFRFLNNCEGNLMRFATAATVSWVVMLLLGYLPVADGAPASYQLKLIAMKDAVFSGVGQWPSINNSGQVAFTAVLYNNDGYRIYVGDGTTNRLIYNPGAPPHSVNSGPTINDSGWVAFGAYTGTNGAWVSNGTST